FVLVAHGLGFLLCRRLGGYDRATAFYAAMPGGLIEAVTLGEAAGGDARVLTTTHFLRIVLVVTLVPLGFLILSGETVGSAAGQGLAARAAHPLDITEILGFALAGLLVVRLVHIPAGHLMAPMFLSATAHGAGWLAVASPDWLLNLSQLMVGVGLGTQFSGAAWAPFFRVFRITLALVALLMGLGLAMALAVSGVSEVPLPALVLSLAPGGVTEMGLIALSLDLSPVLVAAHHTFRIFFTVAAAAISARWVLARPA
ncbi:MAG: AbrB family transcriptional regulator, partial [Pseudomonadota bacterium]